MEKCNHITGFYEIDIETHGLMYVTGSSENFSERIFAPEEIKKKFHFCPMCGVKIRDEKGNLI